MPVPEQVVDRAGAGFWSRVWAGSSLPRLVDPYDQGLRNHVRRAVCGFLTEAMRQRSTCGARIWEAGRGQSIWFPYFAREHGCRVTGLDYCEAGCRSARALLAQAGVDGEVLLADFWSPPQLMLGAFDVVFSNGLIEHFDPPVAAVRALARFLRPGGGDHDLLSSKHGGMDRNDTTVAGPGSLRYPCAHGRRTRRGYT